MDAAITLDKRILTRKWKIEKYQNIREEIQRLWNIKEFTVLLLVLGDLGSVTKNIEISVHKIGIKIYLPTAQESALLGTARI